MASAFTVRLPKLVDEFKLETVYTPRDLSGVIIETSEVNRPGIQFCGFYEFFDPKRIQIIGKTEIAYLRSLTPEGMYSALDDFFSRKPIVAVITWNLPVPKEMLDAAMRYKVPFLRATEGTSEFMAGLILTLNVDLAQRITRHGVLVEVYGEGILLFGESGVGKSETAIELIKRGHRLIADDAVEIRRVSKSTLVGSSPENIRHFMELRGVGIINARTLFGMGAVKTTEKIDIVIQMEQWDQNKVYDRMGADDMKTKILGVEVPLLTIPVKPGRNLAVIIEVAAMNNRQKRMGQYAAAELMERLGMPETENEPEDADWESFFSLDN